MSIRKTGTEAAKGPITVRTTTELRAAIDAGHSAEEITLESVDVEKIKADAVAAAQLEWDAKKKTEIEAAAQAATDKATAAATKAERDRISGLQGIAMKGFEKEVQAAIDSGATVEATAVQITKLSKERGVSVTSLKAGAPGAVQHGGAAPEGGADGGSKWGSIVSRFGKKQKMA